MGQSEFGLLHLSLQIMRFDVQSPVPGVQPAVPFDITQQIALDTALRAQWARNAAPLLPNPATPRQVSSVDTKGCCAGTVVMF